MAGLALSRVNPLLQRPVPNHRAGSNPWCVFSSV